MGVRAEEKERRSTEVQVDGERRWTMALSFPLPD